MIVNWCSPLPPARSGIAEYTRILVPFLVKRAHVAVFTEGSLEKQARLGVAGVTVQSIASGPFPYQDLNRAEVTFYNIGNNATFHARTWELCRQHAGIVILHDERLQHLLAGACLHVRKNTSEYHALMTEYHGNPGAVAAQHFIDGRLRIEELAVRFPLTGSALAHALGVVVHTRSAYAFVIRHTGLPVLQAALPYQPQGDSVAPPKVADRVQKPPYRLIMFGDIGRNRGLALVLRALGTLPQASQFRLDIYGDVADAPDLHEEIRARGLGRTVKLHGYVHGNALDRALRRAHMAINLRTPTMGEASLSQLKMWDYSLPTMVTWKGWYKELNERAVASVRPRHEVSDVQKHLRGFLANPERYRRMGQIGNEILQTDHSPQRYVDALIEFSQRVKHRQLNSIAESMATRAGKLMTWAHRLPQRMLTPVAANILALQRGDRKFRAADFDEE